MSHFSERFNHGSTWLRADFHLHTKADKEFNYSGEDNHFVNNYIEALKLAHIQLGVITNHNKFDKGEFQALRKKAKKQAIALLPGVELSVNDGANGIHTLIVFSEQWLENGHDYINQFLNVVFVGKTPNQYEQENGRTSCDLITTIKTLNGYDRDFFLIFAHVEQSSGLWNELNGGRIQELGKNLEFNQRTLGFQKVRTRDQRDKIKDWLKESYPAELEGSDCKSIKDIGKGKKTFIKLGAFSFDAVKFALRDKKNRLSSEAKTYPHSYIKSIRFEGGSLSDHTLQFSPELNTLIGIRGSGKSSILEIIRYVLEIPFGKKSGDKNYKQGLLGFHLGSGGKVEIDINDRHGQSYTIRRVWKENYSEVLINGKLQPGVSIRETVLHKPIYFGQKDLSNTGEGFEKDLVDKLLGSKLDDIRVNIARQKVKVGEAVDRLLNVSNVNEQLEEQKSIKQDTKHRLQFYAKQGIEEKLQQRLDFNHDIETMRKGIELADNFISDLNDVMTQHEDDLRNFVGYHSKHNKELFNTFYSAYDVFIKTLDQLSASLKALSSDKEILVANQTQLADIRQGMVEKFEEIERKLADELKNSGAINMSSDDFLMLNTKMIMTNQLLVELEKQSGQKHILETILLNELHQLNKLWHQEFILIKSKLDKVGVDGSALSIVSAYKEDKSAFLKFMKEVFKGSGVYNTTFQKIAEQYTDFIDIYKNLDRATHFFGSKPEVLKDLFMQNLKILLSFQTPNKFTIFYHNKELEYHSLGQRASALILFILNQQKNDVIIIDQPEDDLDNQTIYEDVIKLIRQMKPNVQFIFATHNPNIPVLGDAELVHACSFVDDKISVESGSVDNENIQKMIVNIMEGGKEAFDRRKEIYQIWKS